MTGSLIRRLAEWTGRSLLLGVVAFWWGAVVAPQLISISFPSLLPWSALPPQLNPDDERSIANAVSAASLLIVALLALGSAVVSRRRRARPITVGGWVLLAGMAALLAWEEKADFRGWLVPAVGRRLFGDLWPYTSGIDGTFLLSPLIVAFVAAMGLLIGKGLSAWTVRALLILGLTAWLLSIVYDEGGFRIAFLEWYSLAVLLEETLEFSGTLLIGLGAGIALGRGAVSRRLSSTFRRRRPFLPLVGSMAAVAVLGGFVVFVAASTFREPLVDTRGHVVFNVSLYDSPGEEHSLVQELGMLAAPVARLRLRVTNSDPEGRSGVMLWRVMSLDKVGMTGHGEFIVNPSNDEPRILREGRLEVAAGDRPRWENIDFPPLVEAVNPEHFGKLSTGLVERAKDRSLAVQLLAEVEPGAELRIGATKTNRLNHLQFWVNGMKTWPDQKLELTAYGPSDLTLSKVQGLWRTFRWSWIVLTGAAVFGLWLITHIPALLVTAALPRRRLSQ